jgi:hypothetical protein
MSRALVIVDSEQKRRTAAHWVAKAPYGTRIEFKTSSRSLPQNDRLHAMIGEVAIAVQWHGLWLTVDDWKILFLDSLKRELRLVPNLDGTGFVDLGRKTSKLTKEECSMLIELVFKFGAEHGVTFQDDRKAAA